MSFDIRNRSDDLNIARKILLMSTYYVVTRRGGSMAVVKL